MSITTRNLRNSSTRNLRNSSTRNLRNWMSNSRRLTILSPLDYKSFIFKGVFICLCGFRVQNELHYVQCFYYARLSKVLFIIFCKDSNECSRIASSLQNFLFYLSSYHLFYPLDYSEYIFVDRCATEYAQTSISLIPVVLVPKDQREKKVACFWSIY